MLHVRMNSILLEVDLSMGGGGGRGGLSGFPYTHTNKRVNCTYGILPLVRLIF